MNGNVDYLTEIADKLRKENYRVTVENPWLTVSLPMRCSVSAQATAVGAELFPKFGGVSRASAMILTVATMLLYVFLFADSLMSGGVGTLLVVLMVGAMAFDASRWFLTQKVMRRIRQLCAEQECSG
jgi:hypothetical protein